MRPCTSDASDADVTSPPYEVACAKANIDEVVAREPFTSSYDVLSWRDHWGF